MRTLHPALRVSDVDASLRFYAALGYRVVGTVPASPLGALTLLTLDGDEFASLELVHSPEPFDVGSGFSHLAVQVESLAAVRAALVTAGFEPGEIEQPGPLTCVARDPDGYRIELTEWPDGHPAGLTAADFE